MTTSKKRRPLFRRILITVILLLAIGGGIYWYVASEKFSDTSSREASFTVNALDFINEFRQNDTLANKKYTEQIITVNGRVTEVEAADSTVNIKFTDTTSGSYVIFAFQQQHMTEAKTLKPGDSISIKGSCSGGVYSEILGAEFISFKRCALNKP